MHHSTRVKARRQFYVIISLLPLNSCDSGFIKCDSSVNSQVFQGLFIFGLKTVLRRENVEQEERGNFEYGKAFFT